MDKDGLDTAFACIVIPAADITNDVDNILNCRLKIGRKQNKKKHYRPAVLCMVDSYDNYICLS